MKPSIREKLTDGPVEASAPCRVDMGGTLDLSTFHLPLRNFRPCTFNFALGLRTRVTIASGRQGITRIRSRGFEPAEFPVSQAPFDHPLGLMFAIANYFDADGVDISIASESPPRSALGGSSSAAVALTAAFQSLVHTGSNLPAPVESARLAHALEGSVAGVPCGLQDHLAAAYGGIHAWYWALDSDTPHGFKRIRVMKPRQYAEFESHTLVAYGGRPHVSKDINGQWVRQFISGKHRQMWQEICRITQNFIDAVIDLNYKKAARCMHQEVALRKEMTPDVFDDIGEQLRSAAAANDCGVRFTGAGGGGCIWALGNLGDIDRLRGIWENILLQRKDANILDASVEHRGVTVHRQI